MKNLEVLREIRKKVLLALPKVNKAQIEKVYKAADNSKDWEKWNEFFINTLLASGKMDMDKDDVLPYKKDNFFEFPPTPIPDITWNCLTGSDVAKILKHNEKFSLPHGFEKINFTDQRFNETWDMQDWQDAMQAVPPATKKLLLAGNKLGRMSCEDIVKVVTFLPPKVNAGVREPELNTPQQQAFISNHSPII